MLETEESYYKKKVEDFFSDNAIQLSLFKLVEKTIESVGPITIEVTKSQISFGTKTKFAWVWLPQAWSKKRPENCIVLTIGVGRQIENEQIVEAVEPYPGRWTHHIIIETEADMNDDVYAWLCEAYDFSQQRGGKVGSSPKSKIQTWEEQNSEEEE